MAGAAVDQAPVVALEGTAAFTGAHNFSIGKAYMANSINVINNYQTDVEPVPIDLPGHMVGAGAREKASRYKATLETALSQRSADTCNWFLDSPEFGRLVEERGRLLWGTGMPGSGKTILISVCIERLQAMFWDRQDVAIAYAYFRYREQAIWREVLATLIVQLVWSSRDAYNVLLSIYTQQRGQGATTPSERELFMILQKMVNSLGKVFIAIDGLDEVDDETKDKLLESLPSLEANILITSRPLELYASYTPKALWISIQARTEDIEKLVNERIQKSARLKAVVGGKPDLVKKLSDTVKEKSQGMFLLARLQMDALQSSNSVNSLFRTLQSLPSGINEMYQQTLERINAQPEEDASIARRVFLWLVHSFKALTVDELQHALAVSFDDMSYDAGDIVSDSLLLSMCGGLVVTVSVGKQHFWEEPKREVRFIHYTTQEFLKSVVSSEFPNPHALLTIASLGYLQAVDIGSIFGGGSHLHYSDLTSHPFLHYAYHQWGKHAKESERNGPLHHLILSFLQHCTGYPLQVPSSRNMHLIGDVIARTSGLHLASRWGLIGVISSGALPCPPNIVDNKFTPFHLAIGSAFIFSASAPDVPTMLEVMSALVATYGTRAGHIASQAYMGMTPLHLAVKTGSLECLHAVLSLVNSSNPSPSTDTGSTGQADIINITNLAKETPLVSALSGVDATIEMIELLISQPHVDPTIRDWQGHTALYYACSYVALRPRGSERLPVSLLSTFPHLISEAYYSDGAHTNVFVQACLSNRNEAVAWLIAHDPALVHQLHPRTGETALIRVCKQGRWSPGAISMVELLLEHGSDPGVRDTVEGRSAFLWSLWRPQSSFYRERRGTKEPIVPALETLIRHYPHPGLYKQRDKDGRTALMLAAMLNIPDTPIIAYLLSLPEIDVEYCNARDNEGQTALMLACRNTRKDVLRELLQSSLLLPSTIQEGLVYAFSHGVPSSTGGILHELIAQPDQGIFKRSFEDRLTVVLLSHAVKRACKRLIMTLLVYCEGGQDAPPPTPMDVKRLERWELCGCSACGNEWQQEAERLGHFSH